MKSPVACTVIAFPYTTAVNVKKRKIANKSASKHGLKKIAKEIAKEAASEIARAATEKLLEVVGNISNKVKQKGASAQKTDITAATVKRSIKPTGSLSVFCSTSV